MRLQTNLERVEASGTGSPPQPSRLRSALTYALEWPNAQLDRDHRPQINRVRLAVLVAAILCSAVGVRLLYWQDRHVEIVAGRTSLSGVFNRYEKEARRILDEGRILYPRERPATGDARLLAHPPGYSILLAAIYRVGGDESWLWIVQIACDAAAALLVFLIGFELLNWKAAAIGALLVAISPHLAYYSLLLSPDSLAVSPILLAVYVLIKGSQRPSLGGMALAGGLIGVSCWLTANAMLLALFLGAVAALLLERGRRPLMLAALVGGTIVVIAPLTIRNLVVFHRFIPLSIQAGLSLVEGIGDYDKQGSLGMPRSDREARQKDAEWNSRPDYAASLWSPDGIDRDHTRLVRGLEVVRANPRWFLGVMLRRAEFMLSYNDSRAREWPLNTASVPPISAEAGYGHRVTVRYDESALKPDPAPVLVLNEGIISKGFADADGQPAKSSEPGDFYKNGAILSPSATASVLGDGRALEISGDNSEYGDQFASESIAVKKNTDYVLVLPVRLLRGGLALKVTSYDRRTALAIGDVAHAMQEAAAVDTEAADSAAASRMITIQMPFASGARAEVRVVLSNNGAPGPAALVGGLEIFEAGPTPFVLTRYPRMIVRNIQRKFTTGRVLTLVAIGIGLLLLARRGRTILILVVVPLYYLTLQAPLHTEYRYILPIHYFLFVLAGAALYYACEAVRQTARAACHLVRQRGGVLAQGVLRQ